MGNVFLPMLFLVHSLRQLNFSFFALKSAKSWMPRRVTDSISVTFSHAAFWPKVGRNLAKITGAQLTLCSRNLFSNSLARQVTYSKPFFTQGRRFLSNKNYSIKLVCILLINIIYDDNNVYLFLATATKLSEETVKDAVMMLMANVVSIICSSGLLSRKTVTFFWLSHVKLNNVLTGINSSMIKVWQSPL